MNNDLSAIAKIVWPAFSGSSLERNSFFEEQVNKLGLRRFWNWVVANNEPEYGTDQLLCAMHYHSTEHMKQVTAIALWLFEQDIEQDWQYDVGAVPLAMAAMCHDMNHSLGAFSDVENVREAQAMFQHYTNHASDIQAKANLDVVLDLIGITEFPYSDERRPKNLIERCLRDADILYGLQHHTLDIVLFGLCREVNVGSTKFTRTEWAKGRVPFLKSIEMFTPTAKAIMEWELSADNDHNHQARIDVWLREDLKFELSSSCDIRPNDVVFCTLENDSAPKRRLIERKEDTGDGYNIFFDGDEGIWLRNGEQIVVVKRDTK